MTEGPPASPGGADTEDADVLWSLEERFWTGGMDSARKMTARDAVFVFPYPAGILRGDALWREKEIAQRWRSVTMRERYCSVQGNVAVIAYHVCAERGGEPVHEAVCTSTYLRDDDGWRRLTHHQTAGARPD